MKEEDKILLVVTNEATHTQLFRIHIYEDSLRFDAHFAMGIEKNPQLRKEIKTLNERWKNNSLEIEQIFPIMVNMVDKYGEYLQDYFFKANELDENGNYIEPIGQERDAVHFQYLKQLKRLTRISRKEFEKNFINKEITDFYINNYNKRKAKFYTSEHKNEKGINSIWYFMVVNEKFLISYSKKAE